MKRRAFISLLGGAAAAWPLAARAQQPIIGLLSGSSPGAITHYLAAFDRGLADNGFIIGRDVTIDYNRAHGRFDRLPAMAAELVRRQVALIVTLGPPAGLCREGGNYDDSDRVPQRWGRGENGPRR
jgi:putative ABC transport system substrate-binding protein